MKQAPFGIRAASGKTPTTAVPDELFAALTSSKALQTAASQHLHDPERWLREWERAQATHNMPMIRALRLLVQMQTVHAVLRGTYFLPDGRSVPLAKSGLQRAVRGARRFDYAAATARLDLARGSRRRDIAVVGQDCLEAAIELGPGTAVMVMASASHPGGGYKRAAGAQEENMCRRSNLYECLETNYGELYPLPRFGGVVTEGVPCFRASEMRGYAFLPASEALTFVNIAAYNSPPTETDGRGRERLAREIAQDFRRKIAAWLMAARDAGCRRIVLGALGCGAYGCPPEHVAELFHEVIMSKIFDGVFDRIVFAILDDHNAGRAHNRRGNLAPFVDQFPRAL